MRYEYKISVVMAVYNAEPFLQEAIDSLVYQSIGFENIQLILVDDGSQDKSGKICDEYAKKYPDNVIVVHKDNGGVASARNEGLKYTKGKYLNFMDSDDKFEHTAFKKMFEFMELHNDETDIVTVPLKFFDAMHGDHWQNTKFKKGNRVIDLQKEPYNALMFVNASLFSAQLKDKIIFDSSLPCGEDIKVIYTLLLERMTVGVVSNTCYHYRRRSVGGASLIATAHEKKSWYFEYFYNLQFWLFYFYKKRLGYVPQFVKYVFASETQWRFRKDSNNIVQRNILSFDEMIKYKKLLRQSIQEIDDYMLVSEPYIYFEQKLFLLMYKYGTKKAQLINNGGSLLVGCNDCIAGNLSNVLLEISLVRVENKTLKIEGMVTIPNMGHDCVFGMICDEIFYPAEWLAYKHVEKVLDEIILSKKSFCISIDLKHLNKNLYIKYGLKIGNTHISLSNIRYKSTCAITNKYKDMVFDAGDFVVYAEKHWVGIVKKNKSNSFQKQLLNVLKNEKNNDVAKKAYYIRKILTKILPSLKRPIWIVSDRYTKAGDNGEAFFQYMQTKSEIKSYFLLFKSSVDYDRVSRIGKVIEPYSYKHKILHLLSSVIISSHADEFVTNPFRGSCSPYQDILAKKKFVFLQHGITKDDVSEWYNRLKINAAIFVTAAYPEYHSIIAGKQYLYDENVVKQTGFPRYDLLEDKREKIITIMPTWRAYLVEDWEDGSGNRKVKNSFEKSSYYTMYTELLNCEKLINAAKQFGYRIQWVVHPNMQDTMRKMVFDDYIEIISSGVPYKDIFAKTGMLVTDYSSVAFDVAYLKKPVIYYHADYDEYYSGAHTTQKGYFDHEKDGFGEVEKSVEDVVLRLIEYMENDCKIKEKYCERIDGFFVHDDKNNCQRVYDEIVRL